MDNKKRKIRLTIYGLIAALLVLTATSFALWQTTRKQTNFNAIVSACLNLTINNESPEITINPQPFYILLRLFISLNCS